MSIIIIVFITAATAVAALSPLSDLPVVGDANLQQTLSSPTWTANNDNNRLSIPATVPGDLITDLARANVIGDPLFGVNFQGALWDDGPWTLTRIFDDELQPRAADTEVLLMFDSVKMAATVTLNGVVLGDCTNQFVRYNFSVATLLTRTNNVLNVTFGTSQDARNNAGRWQACSGGWDWAPYSNTSSQFGDRTFSKGLVRDVYLIPASVAVLAHVVPRVQYAGEYPTTPLSDGAAAPFTVTVDLVLWAPVAWSGRGSVTATATCGWSDETVAVTLPSLAAGETVVSLRLPDASGVSLWWPAGLGAQQRYAINVSLTPAGAQPMAAATRSVGFRTAYMVTTNDTACAADPACVYGEGSSDFTMRFKINGADFVALGANFIPIEELEGREAAETYVALLNHAVNGNHNTLRVWGGGKYLPRVFYDTCDILGIVLFHDLMYGTPWFGGNGSVPCDTLSQTTEIIHNIRRLAASPAIVVWSGGNEFYPLDAYVPTVDTFLMPTVVNIDSTRAVWPTSPSQGWASGVNTLTGLPSGNVFAVYLPNSGSANAVPAAGGCGAIQVGVDYDHGFVGKTPAATSPADCCALCTADPDNCWAATFYQGVCYFKPAGQASSAGGSDVVSVFPIGHVPPPAPRRIFETHGPYQHGSGWSTVNGNGAMSLFPPNLPPTLSTNTLGPQELGTFASEFGASVFSSAESMAPTLSPSDYSVHAPVMFTRNYPCDNFIQVYFGSGPVTALNTTSLQSLQQATYLCMLAAALQQKGDIETRRSDNAWGTLTWQLNEIWPTGGWGSVEYGTVGFTSGQILGGRWKILHHWMQAHLYAPTVLLCGTDWAAGCLLKHDGPVTGFVGSWSAALLRLSDGSVTHIGGAGVSVPRGGGASQRMCVDNSSSVGQCPDISVVLGDNGCARNGTDCILQLRVTDSSGRTVDSHDVLLVPPALLALPAARVQAAVGDTANPDGSIDITLTATNGVALFVTLTTTESGVFSENAFAMPPAVPHAVTLRPIPGAPLPTPSQLQATLRVEHVALYLL